MGNMYNPNTNQQKVRVAVLISDKVHLRAKRKENIIFLMSSKNTKLLSYKKVIKEYVAKK